MGKSKMNVKKSNTDHCTIRNNNLFCLNCGGEQIIPYHMNTEIFSAMAKTFNKIHAKCIKKWEQPVADLSLTEEQRANWWLEHGERGMSSETIFATITRRPILRHGPSIPYDQDDFKRCYLLLKAIPEWKEKLFMLKKLSPAWVKLVDNWDKLTEMLEFMMQNGGSDNGKMYEFMEELIDGGH